MVCVRFLGCGGSERVIQWWNSPYLEIHSSEGALHKSKNSLALDDLRFSKKWHYLPDGTELYTEVFYYCIYWHSKTCWFTAWENGKQTKNSGPIIFFSGYRVYHWYKSVPACTKKRHEDLKLRYRRWLWGNGIRIFVWNIPCGTYNYDCTYSDIPLLLEVSGRYWPKKSCSIFFPTRFLGNVLWIVDNQCFPSVDGICMWLIFNMRSHIEFGTPVVIFKPRILFSP